MLFKFYTKGKKEVEKELDILRLVKMERKLNILTDQVKTPAVKFKINNTDKAIIDIDQSSNEEINVDLEVDKKPD